jgi:hypothetical protein
MVGAMFPPAVAHARRLTLFAAFASAAACGTPDARFSTKLASDFAPAHRTVSVLGVYKDGRMSSDSWEAIAPRLSQALGAAQCDAAYTAGFVAANETLSSAIDDYAQSNGPTDELLAQLAPAAMGDLVLVMTVAGKLPIKQTQRPESGPTPAPNIGPGGGQGRSTGAAPSRGGRGSLGRRAPSGERDTNELDLSASLFSIAQGRSVALVAMEYSGDSVDDALARFSAELARSLPAAKCVGWNWDAKVDAERIRQSITE